MNGTVHIAVEVQTIRLAEKTMRPIPVDFVGRGKIEVIRK